MRALMRQELRAHLHWGALCFLACALAMGYAVASFDLGGLAPSEVPLTSPIMFLATVLGGALTGITLGLVQMAPEMAPGRWALLVHRPLSRSRIFWSKAAAGLMLYSAAVGVPFASVVWWSATHVPAPFDGRLALGGAVNLLGGVAYYFAALLVALRPAARWLGSRALPLATGLAGSLLAGTATELWEALVVLLVVLVLLAVSAWGTFNGGGLAKPRAKPFFALVVLLGLYGVFCGPGHVPDQDPVFIHRTQRPNRTVVEGIFAGTEKTMGLNLKPFPSWSPGSFRDASRLFLPLQYYPWAGERVIYWYYVRKARRIEGYERGTGKIVGRIGAEGFRARGDVTPFDGVLRYLDERWLVHDAAAHHVDLKHRTIHKVADAATLGSIDSASANSFPDTAAEREILLATRDKIHIIDQSGRRRRSLPLLGSGVRACSTSDVCTSGWNSDWCGVSMQRALDPAAEYRTYGDYIATVGCGSTSGWRGTFIRYSRDGRPKQQVPCVTRVAPLTLSDLWVVGLSPSFFAAHIWGATGHPLPRLWPRRWRIALLHSLWLWSVAGLAVCLWVTRRYRLPPALLAAWALCGLTFGLAGILVLIASHEWPARLPCHRCGKPRCVHLAICPRCGAPLPGPVRDGTEILVHSC